MMKILSIIVPVYNVENYLAKCLDSLLCQGLTLIYVACYVKSIFRNKNYRCDYVFGIHDCIIFI